MHAAPDKEKLAEAAGSEAWLQVAKGVCRGVCLWWLEAAVPLGAMLALGWIMDAVAVGSGGQLARSAQEGDRAIGVAADGPAGAEFFGVRATGKRFIFIVDASISMQGEKFEAAKRELKAAVEKLTSDQSFNVAFFNTKAHWIFVDGGAPQMMQASEENVRTFTHLLETVQLGYNTEPAEALITSVKIGPDAIYLLSDGKFTDNGFTHRWLKGNNIVDPKGKAKKPKVVIHTIAFHNHDGAEGLRTIAAGSGGTYKYVPPAAQVSKKK